MKVREDIKSKVESLKFKVYAESRSALDLITTQHYEGVFARATPSTPYKSDPDTQHNQNLIFFTIPPY